jgi:hypothetical protein
MNETHLILVVEPHEPICNHRDAAAGLRSARFREEVHLALLPAFIAELHHHRLFIIDSPREPTHIRVRELVAVSQKRQKWKTHADDLSFLISVLMEVSAPPVPMVGIPTLSVNLTEDAIVEEPARRLWASR